jgi:hypothetical protein
MLVYFLFDLVKVNPTKSTQLSQLLRGRWHDQKIDVFS